MPQKNGLEVLTEVKEFYKAKARVLAEKGVSLIEPEYVFLTAYMSKTFRKHLESKGVTQIYEKPLLDNELEKILHSID